MIVWHWTGFGNGLITSTAEYLVHNLVMHWPNGIWGHKMCALLPTTQAFIYNNRPAYSYKDWVPTGPYTLYWIGVIHSYICVYIYIYIWTYINTHWKHTHNACIHINICITTPFITTCPCSWYLLPTQHSWFVLSRFPFNNVFQINGYQWNRIHIRYARQHRIKVIYNLTCYPVNNMVWICAAPCFVHMVIIS